jgi:oligogalacturonide lyase
MKFIKKALVLLLVQYCCISVFSQPVLETGGQKMPDEWIDKDTRHKIIKLTRKEGSNYSFYFHNNPFVGNKSDGYKMVFYNTSPQKQEEQAAKVETGRFTRWI